MIIDGRKIRDEIKESLKIEVQSLKKDLRLAIVLAGENPASLKFIEEKIKFGKEIGIGARVYKFDEAISTTALREKLAEITSIKQNTGVVIQLPLPLKINTQYILNSVMTEKDIDVLSSRALGDFYVGRSLILPPVVAAVELILNQIFADRKVGNQVSDFSDKNIVIVGAGRLVGKPLAVWFISHGATVSILNKNTKDIVKFTREADILISGIGVSKFIKADMVKDNAIVLDCGTSVEKTEAGEKYSGDVDFNEVKEKAAYITPVPGGVGPVTVAMLFSNLVRLGKMR